MATKIAINGFGRIGRLVMRALKNVEGLEVVAINDLTDAHTLAHLFKYDSIHRRYEGSVHSDGNSLVIDGRTIPVLAEKDAEKLPWKDLGIDIVLESTGRYTDKAGAAKHLTAGARKVLVSAPAKGADVTIVLGVNDHQLKDEHLVISNASCTTNCVAPMAKVLHENFGIKRGLMTTIHSYTNDQKLLDTPHKDLRRARNAATSMIPTTTGAASAVGLVLPALKGKLDGTSVRVPTPDGSLTDLVVELEKNATVEEINAAFKKAAQEGPLAGILVYSDEPLVSVDIVGDPASCVFDSMCTAVLDGNMVKVMGWYDNEWGYSNRCVDLLKRMATLGAKAQA